MDVAPGTIVFFSDIGCPWASLSVHRLRQRRTSLHLDSSVVIDHHAFPLELFNERPTPKPILDAEVAAIAPLEPALGWRPWRGPESTYPVTTLLPLEAVQAAKSEAVGGLPASEALDAALRTAFYADSRTISLLPTVLDVARECEAVDVDALRQALERGAGRAEVVAQWRQAREVAEGSPHLFLPDGTDVHNPGLRISWTGDKGSGFAKIDSDDPAVYDDLLRRAAG